MRFITVAIGNKDEAYIEKNLIDGINILLSDDNNKGKTILIQSMLYAIGNKPIFPDSFPFKNYYYYVVFEHKGVEYTIIRRGDSFIIKAENEFRILDGISELKRYWSNNIFPLPVFQFRGKEHLADPELFIQMFFVGQDKKDTSTIFNHGYYQKDNFTDMVLSFSGVKADVLSSEDVSALKSKIKKLQSERADILALSEFYKSLSPATEYVSHIKDKEAFELRVSELESIHLKISEIKKERNRAASRKARWNATLKELNSLNRNIEVGELKCMDCNSTNIVYQGKGKETYSFDVSTPEMRARIISSINEKMVDLQEDIGRYDSEIVELQNGLQEILKDEDVTLENIVMHASGYSNLSEIEEAVNKIDSQIEECKGKLEIGEQLSTEAKKKMQAFHQSLVNKMNHIRTIIENSEGNDYSGLFTKRGSTISGSEETVFYISKLLSIAEITAHECPIVMDSFRAEDLSTDKENRAIELFQECGKQCILTTTIKTEETGKYDKMEQVHIIDYSSHATNQLLSQAYVKDFEAYLKDFQIML